jgi:SAM-dependent methyltransferase
MLKRAENVQVPSDVPATDTESPRPTDDIERAFVRLHAENAKAGPTSSSALEQSARVRECLPLLLQQLAIRSVLDVGCGDFSWQRTCRFGVKRYIGIDVAGPLIATLQRTFGDEVRSFQMLDARRDPLPTCDLILCRDVFGRLSNADIRSALERFKDTGAKYLLATTFPEHTLNADIGTGRSRPLNLCAAPFSFPRPVFLINETSPRRGRSSSEKALGLWRLSDLANR